MARRKRTAGELLVELEGLLCGKVAEKREPCDNPAKVWAACRQYAEEQQEHFVVLLLDGRSRIIKVVLAHKGTTTECRVTPKDIFREAVRCGASSLIVAHNHPSGDTEPSIEDRVITRRLQRAGKILGLQLRDHVVFSATGYVSLSERGEL